MKNLTPVLGWGSKKIIGYWNESLNQFNPISLEVLIEAEEDFLRGNSIFPLAIRIMNEKVNGSYPAYRAIGVKPEDPRVIIYRTK